MIEEMIKRVFEIRNSAHVQHWKTKSFSEHEALGPFYESIIDTLDKYVECYQGGVELIKDVEGVDPATIKMIEEQMLWLAKNRAELAKGAPALENILDDLVGTYARTLYKLENLR
jgi:predicted AAA+ superfamily ATPase